MARRVVLFAHYDGNGLIRPYVQHYVRALGSIADRIHFLSTAPSLNDDGVRALSGVCEPPVLVENRGFDFSMWRKGLDELDLAAWDEVVLTNSSVYGPVGELAAVFRAMDGVEADFWGMTDNYELTWHVQSYFLVLRRRVLEASALSQFFSSVLPYRNKLNVILSYEIGLTNYFREQGLRPASFVSARDLWADPSLLARSRGRSMPVDQLPNPTIYLCQKLLEAGMPLVKVEALRDNPGKVDLSRLKHAMAARGYDLALLG